MLTLSMLLALGMPSGPSRYPVIPVWGSFYSFCKSKGSAPAGWSKFAPKSDSSLSYLAANPASRWSGVKGKLAVIYRTVMSGRTLYAFKRKIGDLEYCQFYDFDASARLVVADWKVAGELSKVEELEYTQTFEFGKNATGKHGELEGAVLHRLDGYYPAPHSIGFVGLQIIAVSKESL